jgi:hypothetical protein
MSRDPDDTWDSEPWDPPPFESTNREGWDEDDWEEHFAQQDILSAKYQELFETLCDHPSRDEVIAAELHWRLPEDICSECTDPRCDEWLDDDGPEAVSDDPVEELGRIPAYSLAERYVDAIETALSEHALDFEDDAEAAVVYRAAGEVADRVGGGHFIGYERDSLCGNIACCRRALASLTECFEGLLALRKRGALPARDADRLLARGQRVGDAIAERIEELRSKIWWR